MLISGCGQSFAHAQRCPASSIALATPLTIATAVVSCIVCTAAIYILSIYTKALNYHGCLLNGWPMYRSYVLNYYTENLQNCMQTD